MTLSLRKLLQTARVKQLPKAQIILYEGDVPTETYIIKSGIVKLYNIDDQGNEKILHLLKPLVVIPFAFFSGEAVPTRWYYTALTDCELYVLPTGALHELMARDWPTAKSLMNAFSQELHELLVRLDSLSKTNIGTRLSVALRYLATRHGTKGRGAWYAVGFPVNHQLIADIIGMSRESTAIAMKSLADQKIVRYARGTSLSINFDKLVAHMG